MSITTCKQYGLLVLSTLMATMIVSTSLMAAEGRGDEPVPAPIHQVEEKHIGVEHNDKIDHGDEEIAKPGLIQPIGDSDTVELVSRVYVPPNERRVFAEFTGFGTRVDVWQNEENITSIRRRRDFPHQIQVSSLVPDPANAGEFPLRTEGNLGRVPEGSVAQKPGHEGGQTESEIDPLHWSAMTGEMPEVKLVAMPKVAAVNSEADYPVFFRVKEFDEVKIKSVTFETEIESLGRRGINYDAPERLGAGDHVRGEGSPKKNGETNEYTIFVDGGIVFVDSVAATGYYRTPNIKNRLIVTFKDSSGFTLTGATEWVELEGYLGPEIDAAHIGKVYSNEGGDYPAFDPSTGISRMAWRDAIPYTKRTTGEPLWLKGPFKDPRLGGYTRNSNLINSRDYRWYWRFEHRVTNEERDRHRVSYGRVGTRGRDGPYRIRNPDWLSGSNDELTMATRVSTSLLPQIWSGRGTQWLEQLAGEERAGIFVWYWGVRNQNALDGVQYDLINIQEAASGGGVVRLNKGARMRAAIPRTDDSALDLGVAGASLSLIGLGLRTVGGPASWALQAAAYVTLVEAGVKRGEEIAKVIGAFNNEASGDIGAQVEGFGYVSIVQPDGSEPFDSRVYSDPNQEALGSSSYSGSKLNTTDETEASVYVKTNLIALQTWKVAKAFTISAWATEGVFNHAISEAHMNYFHENGSPDGKYLRVRSDAGGPLARRQWVGEED